MKAKPIFVPNELITYSEEGITGEGVVLFKESNSGRDGCYLVELFDKENEIGWSISDLGNVDDVKKIKKFYKDE